VKPVAIRQNRGLVNSSWHSLGLAEQAWLRFVETIEAMAAVRGDVETGPNARSVARQMHE
jgi:hypothetical protein